MNEVPVMTQSLHTQTAQKDPRAVEVLAKDIYRELRSGGFNERDVLAFAGELLSLITRDVRGEGQADR